MSTSRAASERGAIIIQVMVALVVLSGFTMFVVDYGVMWVGRGQAQNTADAAAMAAAVSLAFDRPGQPFDATGPTATVNAMVSANKVWGDAAVADVSFSANPLSAPSFPSGCGFDNCVKVVVHRDSAHNNPLPTFFGTIVGVDGQGVRAAAVAKWTPANASRCLKPLAIADKWADSVGWGENDTYDSTASDVYIPPSSSAPGTSFVTTDVVQPLQISLQYWDSSASPMSDVHPGSFRFADLGEDFVPKDLQVQRCVKNLWQIRDPRMLTETASPGIDNILDQAERLISLDQNATFVNGKVTHSCMSDHSCLDDEGQPVTQSPRLVSVPVVDLNSFRSGSGASMEIVNILTLFINDVDRTRKLVRTYVSVRSDAVNADPTSGTITPEASFIKAIQLAR